MFFSLSALSLDNDLFVPSEKENWGSCGSSGLRGFAWLDAYLSEGCQNRPTIPTKTQAVPRALFMLHMQKVFMATVSTKQTIYTLPLPYRYGYPSLTSNFLCTERSPQTRLQITKHSFCFLFYLQVSMQFPEISSETLRNWYIILERRIESTQPDHVVRK